MGSTAAVTATGIRVVTVLVDRHSITRSVGDVTAIMLCLRRSMMLHSRRGVSEATNRGCATKCRGRAAWRMYHNLRDRRDAGIGGSVGSGRSVGCWSGSSGSRSGRCFFLGLKHDCSNLLFSIHSLLFLRFPCLDFLPPDPVIVAWSALNLVALILPAATD